MITKDEAITILKSKMSSNLVIFASWESEYDYVFELALKDDDGNIMALMGDSTVRIDKETGEMI